MLFKWILQQSVASPKRKESRIHPIRLTSQPRLSNGPSTSLFAYKEKARLVGFLSAHPFITGFEISRFSLFVRNELFPKIFARCLLREFVQVNSRSGNNVKHPLTSMTMTRQLIFLRIILTA